MAGGLVTPGYFALYLDQPVLLGQSLLTAVVTVILVRFLESFTLLYGRRRFIVTVLIGFILQWGAGSLFWGMALAQTRIDAIGYIIPGLVAYEMARQGFGRTLLALFIVSTLVRICLYLFGLI